MSRHFGAITAIERDFGGGVIRPGVVPVGFEYLQRPDHRSMHGVVGLEAQRIPSTGISMRR